MANYTPDKLSITKSGNTYTLDMTTRVAVDQGTANEGKVLGIGSDGMVAPVEFSGTDFTGATSSTDGTHGLVPAPEAGEESYVLGGNGEWLAPENFSAKIVEITIDPMVNGNGAYEHTTLDNRIMAGMKVVTAEFGNPAAFRSEVTFTCADGSITTTCADADGTSSIKVGVLKTVPQDPEQIHSDEYNTLNNRINAINPQASTGVFADIPFAIPAADWTLSNGVYTYVYENTLLKAQSGVDMIWNESLRTALTGDVSAEKSTGYITFTTSTAPKGELSGVIRILDNISGILPIAKGGTSGVTPKAARLNLNTPIRDIFCDFGLVSSLPQTKYDADLTADMVAFDAVFSNPAAIPTGIDVTFAAGSVTITGTLVSGAETNISFYAHEIRTVPEGTETDHETQRVADFVQVNAQSLTSAQKTQVQTNIGVDDALKYSAQTLTDAQQIQARKNTSSAASIHFTDETLLQMYNIISALPSYQTAAFEATSSAIGILTNNKIQNNSMGTIMKSSDSQYELMLKYGATNFAVVRLSDVTSSSVGTVNVNSVSEQIATIPFNNYTDVSIGNITLNSSGYYDIMSFKPSGKTVTMSLIETWTSTSPVGCFSVVANGNYIIGSANQSINGLKVRFFYK